MINVLVTGASGQLAQCIKSISQNHPSIKCIYKNSAELDITNRDQVDSEFKSIEDLHYCINCAAYTAVDKAESEAEVAYNVNVQGPKNLAEACREYEVTLVHISTDFVFDGETSHPYSENSITNPLSIYGATKLEGEEAIIETLNSYFIFRTSWLYSEYGSNFLKTMLRLQSERKELSVVSDQIGSPTYAKDLAEVILVIIESRQTSYGIYNYSNEGEVSWFDFANEIFRLNKSAIKLNKIKTKEYPTPATRPKYSVLNKNKIINAFDLIVPDWKDSLTEAITNLNLE